MHRRSFPRYKDYLSFSNSIVKAVSFFSGTSGIVLPVPNKQAYPEAFREKSRLSFYASLLNSLEVNSSFYKIPMAITARRWAESVPPGFSFTFKLFKGITHNTISDEDASLTHKFMHVINQATDRRGCLLVQFPRTTTFDHNRLNDLLRLIQHYNPDHAWKVCVEFRHDDWYNGDSYALLKKYAACLVTHDMKRSATPIVDPWTPFGYLRYHGPEDNFRGSYTDDFLREQASLVKSWMKQGKTVYAYFNNTLGDALPNVHTLNRYVSGRY